MSSKIDGVLRELLQKVDDVLYIMTGHDSYPRLVHKYGKDWWTPINEMRARLCTILAAPVVERQPVYQDRYGGGWIDIDRKYYEECLSEPEEHELRILFTDPPELAELQATIARLTAENERLKGGHGEAVAWEVYWADNGEYYFTSRMKERADKLASDPDFKIVPLYTSQPAPVSEDRSTFAEQLEKDIDIHGNYLPGVTCELLFDLGYRKSAQPAPFEFGWDCKSNDGREHRVIGDYCVACLDKVKELNQ